MKNTFADILVSKAQRLQDRGQLTEARAILEELVTLEPLNANARTALGKVCGYQQDHPEAIVHLEMARRLTDNVLETIFTLGYEYCQLGRYTEAIACFDDILKCLPDFPALHRWRGFALGQSGRGEEAWNEYQEALRLKPDYDEVLAGLANLLFLNRHIEEAENYLLQALKIAPDKSAYHNDLGRVYRQQGRMDAAVACYRKALELEPDCLPAASNVLYGLCYLDDISSKDRAEEHCLFAKRFYPPSAQTFCPLNSITHHEKLNIGYLSSDFGTHSVSFFLEPVLLSHDREQFRVFCYSNRGAPDETTMRIKAMDIVWRDVMGIPAVSVAEQIVGDGIDILVDLSGHSAGHRLDVMALKPAPVQVCWIGYPHSTGLQQIDYYISDALCDPPGMTDHLYSERIWRLPRVFSCYLPPVSFPAISQPPFKVKKQITFGSFNNLAKVNDLTLSIWASLLREIPDSTFAMKSAALGGESLCKTVRGKFAGLGVAPERIVLLPFAATTEEHLAHYNQVDIALDTFPYHGTTTTCEALWMGVPVVTMAGNHHLSRVGVSFLHAVGLNDLIAITPEEYVAIAKRLASNRQQLFYLRENLRSKMACSPLMDAVGLTREWEEALSSMYSLQSDKG
jgi:predicted O-linked N-acetylglucosamine transferase (SPINDLY family)